MEGKNLEAVKNTADNFKSILPKDKLSGQDIKNFTKSLFKINDNNFEKQFIPSTMVTGLVSLEIRNGFLIQAMSRRIHKLIQNRKRLRKYFNHMVLMELPLKILNQILHL